MKTHVRAVRFVSMPVHSVLFASHSESTLKDTIPQSSSTQKENVLVALYAR